MGSHVAPDPAPLRLAGTDFIAGRALGHTSTERFGPWFLRGPSPYERFLHRDLRPAAALLAEGAALDTRLATRIIHHLGWLIRNYTAVWKMRLTWLATYLVGGVAIWSPLLFGDIRRGTLSSWWLYGGTLFWTLAWVCAFVKPVFPRIQTYLALPSRLWWGMPRPEPFIQALSEIGTAQAIPPLLQALGDSEWVVRKAAAEALGKIGTAQAIPPPPSGPGR